MAKTQSKSSILRNRRFRTALVALAILVLGIVIGASGSKPAQCEPAAAATVVSHA